MLWHNDSIDNLKLNKLCYYAQVWSLVRLGKPLFDDVIEAWKYGPVIPAVYRAYSDYGDRPIVRPTYEYDESSLSSEEISLLTDVYITYSQFTSAALVSKTHKPGGPWSRVYIEDQNSIITNDLILNCFKDSKELESMELNITPDNVVTYA